MLIIKILNIKTVKRRVDIEGSQSELVMVKGQCEVYIEEHLRVSNRKP
jgi:competence protein ComGC